MPHKEDVENGVFCNETGEISSMSRRVALCKQSFWADFIQLAFLSTRQHFNAPEAGF